MLIQVTHWAIAITTLLVWPPWDGEQDQVRAAILRAISAYRETFTPGLVEWQETVRGGPEVPDVPGRSRTLRLAAGSRGGLLTYADPVREQRIPGRRVERALLENSRYAAVLKRTDPTSAWILVEVQLLPSSERLDPESLPLQWESSLRVSPYTCYMGGVSLANLLERHPSAITDIRPGPGSTVRLEFAKPTTETNDPAIRHIPSRRGFLELDNAQGFAIRRYEFKSEALPGHPAQVVSGAKEYEERDGRLLLVREERKMRFGDAAKEVTLVAEFRWGFDQGTETDFTLSAFGLPEPFGITWDRPTPWWLYALISAGVLFVVAVIVSFWKRRLAARQAG